MNAKSKENLIAKTNFLIECKKILGPQIKQISLIYTNAQKSHIELEKNNGTIVGITVKASKCGKIVTKLSQKGNLNPTDKYVFVDTSNPNPNYYILLYQEVINEQLKVNTAYFASKTQTPPIQNNGVDNIPISNLAQYKNQWFKLLI